MRACRRNALAAFGVPVRQRTPTGRKIYPRVPVLPLPAAAPRIVAVRMPRAVRHAAVPLPCRRIRPSLLLPMSAVSLWLQGGAPRPSYRLSRWRRCASCLACRLSSSPAAITRQPPVPPPPPQTSFRASSSLLSRRRDHGARFPRLPPAADPNRPGPSPSRGPMCLRVAVRSQHRVRGPYRRHLRPDTARTRCTRRAAQSRPTPRSSAAA
jgi:hypothetical protein